jgi:nitrate reductase NapE component
VGKSPTKFKAKSNAVTSSNKENKLRTFSTLSIGIGSLLVAAIQFALSYNFLRSRIQRMLAAKPSLAAILSMPSDMMNFACRYFCA